MNEKKIGRLQIILLGLLNGIAPLAMDFYLPGLPALQHDLETSASLAQITMTATLFGIALGQALIGPWSDHIGRRRPLIAGMLLFTLSSLAIVFAPNIWLMIVLRFIQGLSGSAGIVLSLAILTDVFSGPALTKNVTINQTINGVFPVLAPVLGGIVVGLADWQMTFWVLTITSFGLLLGVVFFLPETRKPLVAQQIVRSTAFLKLLQNRHFTRMLIAQAAIMATLFTYIAGSTFVLEKNFQLSTTAFGIIYALNGAGMAVMTYISGRIARHIGAYTTLGWFIKIAIGGALLLVGTLAFSPNLWLFVGTLMLTISALGGTFGMSMALALAGQREHSGAASALLGVSRYLVAGIMAPVVGLFGETSYAPMAILMLVTLLVAYLFYRMSRYGE
ncbi:Bcr/CflA family efflux MFS transporter [Weissella soli]|uniref:multidrug effflux MFS transporter n=1 Tax=Weissella soli TaxID=155866 RepID=UPI0021BFAD20|nr:multidrug effflux MFS transporter [Weissella soli]MCT8395146.1 Bcr/CflA family efflux MFS transporter [Weissella soli]